MVKVSSSKNISLTSGNNSWARTHLRNHIIAAARTPAVATHRLRPEAKGAERWASPRSVKGKIRVIQKRDIIPRNIEIAFKDFYCERQSVKVFNQGAIGVMKYVIIFSETDAVNFFEFFPPGKFGHRIVKLFSYDKVDRR